MVDFNTRTIGRYAHPSRMAAAQTPPSNPIRRQSDSPLFMFFDGMSFKAVSSKNIGGAYDLYSNYGITGAMIRPGKLQQNDWDWARAAVQCEYVFRGIEMVASDIASIPHGVRRRATKQDWPDHPLMLALSWARKTLHQDILSLWQKSRFVFGETYLAPISNGFTDPTTQRPYYNGLQWLNPLVTEPYVQYGQLQWFDYSAYGMQHLYPNEVVMDTVASLFDDIRGQSLVATSLENINITLQVKRFTLESFIRDMRMQGVITGRQGSELEQGDIDSVVELLKEQTQSRLVGIPYPVEYTPIQHKWDDSQYKAMDEALRAIAAALGIPLSVLGAWFAATYQSAPAQIEFYQDKVIFRECDRLKLFIDDVLLPYFDPYGEGEWYYDKDAAMALTEDKVAKTNMVNSRMTAGNLTINEARAKLGDKPLEGGDVLIINGGQLVTLDQLKRLSQQPMPLLPDSTPAAAAPLPTPPAPAAPKAIDPTPQLGMKSATLMLTMPNQPDLINLQTRVKEIVGDAPCKWNEPGDFHVTLVYMPVVTDEQLAMLTQAMPDVELEDEMPLRVGSLGAFDNVDEHALHFKVRQNADLYELQNDLFDVCKSLDIPIGSFYQPEKYIPHITMGYASQPLKRTTFNSKLKINPAALSLKSGDMLCYHRPLGIQSSARAELSTKGALLLQDEVEYSETSPNPPIACKNCRWFSSQFNTAPCNIVVNAPLTIVLDGLCKRWEPIPDGSTVNAWITDNTPDTPNYVAELVPGPLEGGEPQPAKAVKSIHIKALEELDQWQKNVKNKGAAKSAEAFETYLIREEVALGIRGALIEAGDDREAIKAVFDRAREFVGYKAIDDTRSAFISEIQAAMEDGIGRWVTKAATAARIRGAITRYGKLGYSDGLEAGGVSADDMDEDDKLKIADLNVADSQYVSDLVNEIYSDDGMKGTPDSRAAKWQSTLDAFYMAGLASADGNSMYRFDGDDGKESCSTCQRLKGQVHRLKDWTRKQFRPGVDHNSFECGSWPGGCSHELVKVAGKASGDW